MFDFLDSDWFNITLQIVFLLLISYDIKKYFESRKRQYLLNIVLTIGFGIWALYPYYKSYIGWNDLQKGVMITNCSNVNDIKLCKCLDDATFKHFTHDEYIKLDKQSSEYEDFLKDAKEDCLDDSWF